MRHCSRSRPGAPTVPRACGAALLLAVVALPTAGAEAHTTGRAFLLLLPTHLYIIEGALVVVASFLLVSLIPSGRLASVERLRRRVGIVTGFDATGGPASVVPSLLSLLVVLALVAAGYSLSG